MTIRVRPGMELQLPSGNLVRVITVARREATVEYIAWSKAKGEVVFNLSWLARCSIVVSRA